jgi:DnaJ domain
MHLEGPAAQSVYTYTPLPSAFQIVETPMRYIHERWMTSMTERSIGSFSKLTTWLVYHDILKDGRDFDRACEFGKNMILQSVIFPIATCGVPLTIVADIVTGFGESIFCTYKGLSYSDVASIAKRKIITAPLNQVVFLTTLLALPAIIAGTLLCGLRGTISKLGLAKTAAGAYAISFCLLSNVSYQIAQRSVRILPEFLSHKHFNIFIDGGAENEFGEKFVDDIPDTRDYWKQYKRARSKQSSQSSDSHSKTHKSSSSTSTIPEFFSWTDYLGDEFKNISRIIEEKDSPKYKEFKQGIFANKTPRELLEFPTGSEKSKLKKTFGSFALALHPDKNLCRAKEAEALFKCLTKAVDLLDSK